MTDNKKSGTIEFNEYTRRLGWYTLAIAGVVFAIGVGPYFLQLPFVYIPLAGMELGIWLALFTRAAMVILVVVYMGLMMRSQKG